MQGTGIFRTRQTTCPPRRMAVAAALALLGGLGLPVSSRAGLVVEVVPFDTDATAGSSGTFELDLLNPTGNSQSYDVAGFQFDLRVPSGAGVLFTDATTATSLAPYIFSGNSVADSFFGGSLIIAPPPPPATSDLQGFDTVLIPGTFTTIQPGDVYGLGLIYFSVDAGAASGVVPISVIPLDNNNPFGTQISDPNNHAIPFSTSNGQITIQSSGAVPEPATFTLVLFGGSGLMLMRRGRNRRSSAGRLA